MLLVCIDNSFNVDGLTLYKSYELNDLSIQNYGPYYYIKDDFGKDYGYKKNRFVTIEEFRDMKINMLIS